MSNLEQVSSEVTRLIRNRKVPCLTVDSEPVILMDSQLIFTSLWWKNAEPIWFHQSELFHFRVSPLCDYWDVLKQTVTTFFKLILIFVESRFAYITYFVFGSCLVLFQAEIILPWFYMAFLSFLMRFYWKLESGLHVESLYESVMWPRITRYSWTDLY
jgi:hypothetical protein